MEANFDMETRGKLGARIVELRRAKGMTQEQLAAALGVSSPAVSKWETDTSCPDIALLCPLARALGTNVDTLLQFEAQPSEEQVTEWMNELLEQVHQDNCGQAEKRLLGILHRYPSSIVVKYHAVVVLTCMELWGMGSAGEEKQRWKDQKKLLLEQIYEKGSLVYRQLAAIQLASIAIGEEDLERGEQLLKELPKEAMQYPMDPTMMWTLLYQKRGENDKAREMLQKRLFSSAHQVRNCLIQLMNSELEPDAGRALEICEIYRQVGSLFGIGGGMDCGLYAEIYMRAGQKEKSLECILEMVKAACGTVQIPNPLLFANMAEGKNTDRPAMTKEFLKLLLKGLQEEERYAPLREDARYLEAVRLLEERLSAP